MFNAIYKIIRLFVVVLIIASFSSMLIYAQTPTASPTPKPDTSGKASELSKKISELEGKVAELKSQGNSLSSQIGAMDNQIKLIEYRIAANKQEIDTLSRDIDTAGGKMKNLESSLSDVSKILINRIVATYETGGIQPIHVIASSDDLTNLFARANYLRIVQAHDKKLMYNAQQAKNDYANQKNIFEDKKTKIESLKAELEGYTAQLDQEKDNKEKLLAITKNDEGVFQQRLQAARAEQAAISQIFSGGGNAVSVGPVNEGDVVGYVINGRSACSTGAHLHFETHNGGYQDPAGHLVNKSVIWDNGPDSQFSFSGSLQFPLSDPVRILQGYGMTYYASVLRYYSGGPHTGIDMYSSSSLAVRSVKSGTLYRGSIACGGGQLPFSRVDHDNGFQTYYLHIIQ